MFGLPVEVAAGLVSGLGGFLMKMSAQKQADNVALIKLGMAKSEHSSKLADAAAKRSSPWLRKFAGITVLLVAFVGTFVVAFYPNIPVSVVYNSNIKELLWGLFRWGGEPRVLEAQGFVMQEWFRTSVVSIVMFLFGTGAAKVSR